MTVAGKVALHEWGTMAVEGGAGVTNDRHDEIHQGRTWFSGLSLSRDCLSCGGAIPFSQLNGRGRKHDQVGFCDICGRGHRQVGSYWMQARRFLCRCMPMVLVSLWLMSLLIETFLPSLVYQTDTGLTKFRGTAFPLLAVAFYLPAFAYFKNVPIEQVEQ